MGVRKQRLCLIYLKYGCTLDIHTHFCDLPSHVSQGLSERTIFLRPVCQRLDWVSLSAAHLDHETVTQAYRAEQIGYDSSRVIHLGRILLRQGNLLNLGNSGISEHGFNFLRERPSPP